MITCLNLIVGSVQTPYKKDVLQQCYDFLALHKNLCKRNTAFYIDGVLYCSLADFVDDEHGFACAFRDYEGDINFVGVFE